MDNIQLNTKHRCWLRFIYTCNIYDDILEGSPNVEWGATELVRLKEVAAFLTHPNVKTTVLGESKAGKEVLPFRGNIAYIYDGDNRGNVIWFDEAQFGAITMLQIIVDREGFFKLTEPYYL